MNKQKCPIIHKDKWYCSYCEQYLNEYEYLNDHIGFDHKVFKNE